MTIFEYRDPVDNPRITDSFFSQRVYGQHDGTDYIDRLVRQPYVKTMRSGRVFYKGFESQQGYHCIVDSGGGCYIRYLHFARSAEVNVGQDVPLGWPLGVMGETGLANGIHVHIDISFRTMSDALAELARFGCFDATRAHWRLNQAFIDSRMVVNKEVVDEMDTIIIIQTQGGPAQYIYNQVDDKAQHLSWPGLLAINAAETQGKVKVARVELTDAQITGIGKILT